MNIHHQRDSDSQQNLTIRITPSWLKALDELQFDVRVRHRTDMICEALEMYCLAKTGKSLPARLPRDKSGREQSVTIV